MSKYEAAADDLDGIKSRAEEYGFCLVRNVFTADQMNEFRAAMAHAHADFDGNIPDLMSCPSLRPIIIDPRVLAIARRLLGENLVYYPETAVNYEAAIGPLTTQPFNELHADAVGSPTSLRKTWSGAPDAIFKGYRFGLYFQDYSRHSGGLKVGVGTHKGDPELLIENGALDTTRTVQVFVTATHGANVYPCRMKLYNIPSRPGDLVIWNLRTFHAAGFKTLDAWPQISVHPAIENVLEGMFPGSMRPFAGPRLAVFFDLAAVSEDIDLYIKSRTSAHDYDVFKRFAHAQYDRPPLMTLMESLKITPRFDYSLAYLVSCFAAISSGNAADLPHIAADLLRLADLHREYSPHFPLFDQTIYRKFRGKDDQAAFETVVAGVCDRVRFLRNKRSGDNAIEQPSIPSGLIEAVPQDVALGISTSEPQ